MIKSNKLTKNKLNPKYNNDDLHFLQNGGTQYSKMHGPFDWIYSNAGSM
jgi:hypothetical protein